MWHLRLVCLVSHNLNLSLCWILKPPQHKINRKQAKCNFGNCFQPRTELTWRGGKPSSYNFLSWMSHISNADDSWFLMVFVLPPWKGESPLLSWFNIHKSFHHLSFGFSWKDRQGAVVSRRTQEGAAGWSQPSVPGKPLTGAPGAANATYGLMLRV